MRQRVTDALRATFRPEFLNRIDETIVFHKLGVEHIGRIVDIQMGELQKRLADRKITVHLTDTAKDLLVNQGYDPAYGARPLKRAIQRLIQDPLALEILKGTFAEGDNLEADAKGEEIVFQKAL
jgi:ATP-dependent Clp protease ATP-binding subunit ClpB